MQMCLALHKIDWIHVINPDQISNEDILLIIRNGVSREHCD